MTDFIDLAVYGERAEIGGIEMVADEDGNLFSLENLEDKLRGMLPGANLVKRILPRKRPTEKIVLSIPRPVSPEYQPGTFLRPVLENPYVESKS